MGFGSSWLWIGVYERVFGCRCWVQRVQLVASHVQLTEVYDLGVSGRRCLEGVRKREASVA